MGLGNPGDDYRRTRHNVGFRVVDALAAEHRFSVRKRQGRSLVGAGRIGDVEVVLAKPQTYMNSSGRAAAKLLEIYDAGAQDLLVVCDDFHLDLGVLRVRRRGSSGGQKGLQSIIDVLGSQDFARVRVGIGSPKGDPVSFVLDSFSKSERPLVKEAVARAAQACTVCILDGIDACMSAFN